MKLVSFYPGPSQVYSGVPEYLYEAYMDGVLSFNHRSEQFSEMLQETLLLLKEKLSVPKDYEIIFCSSATECWEIIAQSLTNKESFHFYNGSFGEKWMNYSRKLKKDISGHHYHLENELPVELKVPESAEIIAITQNETSNGTQVRMNLIKELSDLHPQKLLAIDATSSMAGITMEFDAADIWFASVQKCFGLPAGLSLMILSPRALRRSREIGETAHYNSLNFILENIRKFQTPYTPNILDIYLLKRTLEVSKGTDHLNLKLKERRKDYEEFFSKLDGFEFLVQNPRVRSDTVLTLKHSDVESLKKAALDSSILLGNGYGTWKESTIRIANFPALKKRSIQKLKNFLLAKYGNSH